MNNRIKIAASCELISKHNYRLDFKLSKPFLMAIPRSDYQPQKLTITRASAQIIPYRPAHSSRKLDLSGEAFLS